jgi:hypothetical protein
MRGGKARRIALSWLKMVVGGPAVQVDTPRWRLMAPKSDFAVGYGAIET